MDTFTRSTNIEENLEINGCLTVLNTSGNSIISFGRVFIKNTTDCLNISSGGSLIIDGGARISKALYIENGLDLNNMNIKNVAIPIENLDVANKYYVDTKFGINDIFLEYQFFAVNNINIPEDITGFYFDSSTTRFFSAICSVTITTLSSYIISVFYLDGLQISNNNWIINSRFIGNNTDIIFSINNFGQIQYTSSNISQF